MEPDAYDVVYHIELGEGSLSWSLGPQEIELNRLELEEPVEKRTGRNLVCQEGAKVLFHNVADRLPDYRLLPGVFAFAQSRVLTQDCLVGHQVTVEVPGLEFTVHLLPEPHPYLFVLDVRPDSYHQIF